MTVPVPREPTRLIEPGERTVPRTAPSPDGLLDVRTLPLDPIPDPARHFAVVSVGAELGTQFEACEIPTARVCPTGAVLITCGPATTPGSAPDHVSVIVGLAEPGGRFATAALWPSLGFAWPEIVRTTAVFAARHRERAAR